jgi:uncharacterized protein (TIGR03067 family)
VFVPELLLIALVGPPASPGSVRQAPGLEGKWQMVQTESNMGAPTKVKDIYVTFKNGLYLMEVKGFFTSEGQYFVDATKQPKHLAVVVTKSKLPGVGGMKTLGIYEIRGDNLVHCVTNSGKPLRPTKFAADKDKQQILSIYEKVKQ